MSALKYWKKEIQVRDQHRTAQRAAREATRHSMRLLPVRIVESQPAKTHSGVEVVLRGGRVLRVAGDFDSAILHKLVLALEGA
jgi:hypothetical protein